MRGSTILEKLPVVFMRLDTSDIYLSFKKDALLRLILETYVYFPLDKPRFGQQVTREPDITKTSKVRAPECWIPIPRTVARSGAGGDAIADARAWREESAAW